MNSFTAESNFYADLIAPTVGGAAKNGINISLKNAQKALLYCIIKQGADGTQTTWEVVQSSGNAGSASGTGEKAITNNVPIWISDTAAGTNLLTATTAAKVYQTSITQSVTKVVVFEIVPELCMDLANSFDCVTVNTQGDPGAANTVHAFALIVPRYSACPNVFTD